MKKISYIDAQRIIDIACIEWKQKLAQNWAIDICTKQDVVINDNYYAEMRKACTKEQHVLFDEIFGKDNKLPMKFEEIGTISGYFVRGADSTIATECNAKSCKENKNVFPEEKYAKASLAMSQLLQLHKAWGGVIGEVEGCYAVGIDLSSDAIKIIVAAYKDRLFKFKNKDKAELFLKTFIDLFEEARPFLFV